MIKDYLKQIKEDGEATIGGVNGGQGDLGVAPNNPLQVITGVETKDNRWGFRSLVQQVLKDKDKKERERED